MPRFDDQPLVSVITPTWRRHRLLIDRCMKSVATLDWPNLEHIIVSDGPDLDLRAELKGGMGVLSRSTLASVSMAGDESRRLAVRFDELPEHDEARHWGNAARRHGLSMAAGEFIAYLDDDDRFFPNHLATLMPVLLADETLDFAYSQMLSHFTGDTLIGNPIPQPGHIGTPMIVHRKRLLELATWGGPSAMEDWDLVNQWVALGARFEFIPVVTSEVWPSGFHHH